MDFPYAESTPSYIPPYAASSLNEISPYDKLAQIAILPVWYAYADAIPPMQYA